MVPKRPALPENLKQDIMYDSAFACCVCQDKGDHIHHIDKDNSNNDLSNLVLLCQSHHDEAHTSRELSLNLTPARISSIKESWLDKVRKERAELVTVSGQKRLTHDKLMVGVAWGYINHSRLIQSVTSDQIKQADQNLLSRLKRNGVVDERGIPLLPTDYCPSSSLIRNTIYDWFNHGDSLALHMFYSGLVDLFTASVEPIYLDNSNWKKRFLKQALKPGKFIFINRGQYFRKKFETHENAEICVQAVKNKIQIRYMINTRNMYGTTSITVSFTGHRSCAAFLQVKSLEVQGSDLVFHCTPIALGVGFYKKGVDLSRRTINHESSENG